LAPEALIAIIIFVLAVALLTFASDKAVEHSLSIALSLGASPLIVGLLLVSIGTDLPEITNSIFSSATTGHGDINIGDSLGSAMTQMTLVLGLLPFFGGMFRVKRKEIAVMGTCEILALILALSIAEKGYITRINAFFLVLSWLIFMLLARGAIKKRVTKRDETVSSKDRRFFYHFTIAILGFIGVAIGAYALVQSVITLSKALQVSEYLISFFIMAIGTSLPEFVVDLTALRKKQHELAIGDIIGSSLVDATLSIGIGQLLFPTEIIDIRHTMTTGLYAVIGSALVILMLVLTEKVDRKVGAFFIVLYLLSYTTLYI
jgi:cation:H+ antiporter